MFEFDAGKLIIIGIVALIFIGPKELPRVMRQVGQAIAKIRRLGAEFQAQFMDAMREADLEEIKEEAAKISEAARLDAMTDPFAGIRAELTKNIEELEAHPQPVVLPAAPSEPLVAVLGEDQAAQQSVDDDRTPPVADSAVPAISASEVEASEPVRLSERLHKRA